MKYYVSKNYESYKGMAFGKWGSNTFLVLSDEERFRLGDKVEQLEKDIKANPLKKRFNKHDRAALVFLKRMCVWTIYEESEAIDPTQYQIDTIVNKLLMKVYGPYFGEFINWLKLWVESEKMTADEMRDHMDRKRRIIRKMKAASMLPQEFKEP